MGDAYKSDSYRSYPVSSLKLPQALLIALNQMMIRSVATLFRIALDDYAFLSDMFQAIAREGTIDTVSFALQTTGNEPYHPDMPIKLLKISNTTRRCLQWVKINTVGELMALTKKKLSELSHLGNRALKEIKATRDFLKVHQKKGLKAAKQPKSSQSLDEQGREYLGTLTHRFWSVLMDALREPLAADHFSQVPAPSVERGPLPRVEEEPIKEKSAAAKKKTPEFPTVLTGSITDDPEEPATLAIDAAYRALLLLDQASFVTTILRHALDYLPALQAMTTEEFESHLTRDLARFRKLRARGWWGLQDWPDMKFVDYWMQESALIAQEPDS